MHGIIPTSVCPTGYLPVANTMVPMVSPDSITVSWPAPDSSQFVKEYILEVTLQQLSRRKKRQAVSFNRTITAPETSYTLRDNIEPYTRYSFRVFSNFGNGVVSLTVDPFTAQTGEARTLLNSSVMLCSHRLLLDPLSDPPGHR